MKPRGDTAACARRRQLPLALLAVAALTAGLWTSARGAPAAAQQVVMPPVEGLVATLEDEVRELSAGRIAWATYWRLCWRAYPGATEYELQRLTGEGSSRKLGRQSERCLRIEAAKGENAESQGLVSRDLLLALQAGQLAYRVRAVLNDERVSAWSRPLSVGEVTHDQP